MRNLRLIILGIAVAMMMPGGASLEARQVPLDPVGSSGRTVTPVFEGWYRNTDGTYNIYFGYYSRNAEQVLEIPMGPDNMMEPAHLDGWQPTQFQPRRHWGVFAVTVPADFGDQQLVWTLKNGGQTFSIPGHLMAEWEIDALGGEAGSGNTPPVLKFDMAGPEGRGPLGITAAPLRTSVGKPLTITVWASDDGRTSGSVARTGGENVPVALAWFKHQGPGDVTFSEPTAEVPVTGGSATTTATFSEPGEYVLRVRANDASGVRGGGHAQCCWTNGFVRVTVTY